MREILPKSNVEAEMETMEIDSVDVGADPLPFDVESNADMETKSVWSGGWVTAIDSIDVDADPVPFIDVEGNAEMERESVESWYTAFHSVDECVTQVPFTRTGSDTEYHGGMPLGRISSAHETSSVLAQEHAVLTPALAEAVWHILRAPAVECLADEHPTEFCVTDSAW